MSRKIVVVSVLAVAGAFAAGRVTATKTSSAAYQPASAPQKCEQATPTSSRSFDVRQVLTQARSAGSEAPASADEVKRALDKLDQTPRCEQREDDRLKLIEEWARTNPLGALDYVQQHLKGDRRAQATAAVVTVWARHDPGGAWQWSRALAPDQVHHSHTVLEEVAKNDPALAAEFAISFGRERPEEAAAMSLTAMRGLAHEGNFEAVRKLASDVPLRNMEEQAMLLNFTAGQWARHEPENAAKWVQDLRPGPLRDQAMIGLGESWAEVDPPRAASFAAALPTGAPRQAALRQAITNWVLTDPVAASRWVSESKLDGDFDQAIAAVATLRYLMEDHVAVSLTWANKIVNEELRLTTLGEILSTWALRDRNAALNYVRSSVTISESARQRFLSVLGSA